MYVFFLLLNQNITCESYFDDFRGDIIALIDERPDLRYIKGQNQRTFDIGTFPRYITKRQLNTKRKRIINR